mmetsp:Transcript_37029/g.104559  ORF Transcript_37029/g.104559 Transcript_37029/m.104559 type:complete len:261 (-) Transcript_37029:268-1050(-)
MLPTDTGSAVSPARPSPCSALSGRPPPRAGSLHAPLSPPSPSQRSVAGRLAAALSRSMRQRAPIAAGSGGGSTSGERNTPWNTIFSLRERDLAGKNQGQEALMSEVALSNLARLGVSPEEAAQRLEQLAVLLPETFSKVHRLTPAVLSVLTKDLTEVARKLVQLKNVFPAANLDAMVSAYPQILDREPEQLGREAAKVAEILGVEEMDSLVEEYPRILDAEAVLEAMEMLRALIPGSDPRKLLASEPTMMSRLERGRKLP